MKKILALVLSLCMALSLCGCGQPVSEKTLDEIGAIVDDMNATLDALIDSETAAPTAESASGQQ